MTQVVAAAATAAVAAALISGSAITCMRRRLHDVLCELCVLEHRAAFWERTCWLALVLGVALTGSLALPLAAGAGHLTEALALVVRAEAAGGVMGIAVIGTVVIRETWRFAREGLPQCAVADDATT